MKVLSLLFVSFFAMVSATSAATVKFAWDPSESEGVAGYKLYVDDAAPVDVGNVVEWSTVLADGVEHRAKATAYDGSGYESGFSNEVVFITPLPPPNFRVTIVIELEASN